MDGIKQYMKILGNFDKVMCERWTNIRSFWVALMMKFGYEGYGVQFGKILENIYLLVCITSMFRTKKSWKQILFLAGIMSLYIPNSYRYVSIYMSIPAIFWYSQQEGKWYDYVYCILFSFIFTIPTYAFFMGGDVDFCIFAPIYLMMIYSLIETWFIDRLES